MAVPTFVGDTYYLKNLAAAKEYFTSHRWRTAIDTRRRAAEARTAEQGENANGNKNGKASAFVFLRVPAFGSLGLIRRLKRVRLVKEAAAVYTDYDVVAYLSGPASDMGNAMFGIAALSGTTGQRIHVARPADDKALIHDGAAFPPSGSVCAYVVVSIQTIDQDEVLYSLRKFDECDYVVPLQNDRLLIARVTTEDTAAFNVLIMQRIQTLKGVTSTRSFITIDLDEYRHP